MSFSDRMHVRWRWRTGRSARDFLYHRRQNSSRCFDGCARDRMGMINQPPSTRGEIYGYRARIGYTCPPLSAEVFPYEFYKLVPAGVTLVITTLTVIERSQSEVDAAYEMSMRAARELAGAGVDLVFLGSAGQSLPRRSERAGDAAEARGGGRRQGLIERRRAGKGGEGPRLQESGGGAPLWRARGCATDRRRPTLWLRSARRHGMWQGHQTLRPHPGDGRARHGPRADARAPARRRDLFPFAALAGDRSHRGAGAGVRRDRDGGVASLRVGRAAPRRGERSHRRLWAAVAGVLGAPTRRSSDPEQFLRKPAGDRGDRIGFQPSRRDDLGGLFVADRERHVGAHHHTVGADHLHDKSQRPRVMQDAVGIK